MVARHVCTKTAILTKLVRLHVPAKRYLCAVDPEYWEGLSDVSKRSLKVQGGPLSPAEAAEFAALPYE